MASLLIDESSRTGNPEVYKTGTYIRVYIYTYVLSHHTRRLVNQLCMLDDDMQEACIYGISCDPSTFTSMQFPDPCDPPSVVLLILHTF